MDYFRKAWGTPDVNVLIAATNGSLEGPGAFQDRTERTFRTVHTYYIRVITDVVICQWA